MASVIASHDVYNTGARHHIDAVAVSGGDAAAVAIATSSLTGDSWDGCLTVFHGLDVSGEAQPARVTASATTPSGIADVAWLAGGNVLATGDDRGDLTLWQLDPKLGSCTVVATFGEHTQPISALSACENVPARVVTASLDGTARVWNAAVAGECQATLEHLPLRATWGDVAVHSVAWLDDAGHLLATGASDGVTRLWDVRQSAPAATHCAPHTAALLCLAAPHGSDSQILAGSECGSLLLLDTRKLEAPVARAQVHAEVAVSSLSLAPHTMPGTMVPTAAVATEDGSVTVVDPRDLHVLASTKAHGTRVGGLGWLGPNHLLSGGWDRRLVRTEFAPLVS